MKKKFGEKRAFLNPKEGVAAAWYYATVEHEPNPKGKNRWPTLDLDCSMELSDCNRQIHLDFDVWASDKAKTLREIREKRAKVARLQEVINGFAESANEALDYVEDHLDAYFEAYAKKTAENKNKKKKK